jgi:hypothetical protein
MALRDSGRNRSPQNTPERPPQSIQAPNNQAIPFVDIFQDLGERRAIGFYSKCAIGMDFYIWLS